VGRAFIKIAVNGFTPKEAIEGIPALQEEFQKRYWILNPSAKWDDANSLLIISVGYGADDLKGAERAALDEVWDCVIACIHFSGDKIYFEQVESKLV
jgi:hypothetical protein